MNEGNITLAPLLTAGGQPKLRPALILRKMPGFGDYLVCGISTQLHQEVEGFDIVLSDSDHEFPDTGLRQTSLVRLSYLASVPAKKLPGKMGSIPSRMLSELQNRLSAHLTLESNGD